ncbi:hypothetical protein EVAR_91428_1 [Eumeta japonica]|uniref:Uncharacterized protein n=1 Tax=Eumeta variegata TaxID=151549 RepID=A0A4C1WZ23_EUMVA|nr:hypothetical protein EVAR_91428_1 [Eumeta japonica]
MDVSNEAEERVNRFEVRPSGVDLNCFGGEARAVGRCSASSPSAAAGRPAAASSGKRSARRLERNTGRAHCAPLLVRVCRTDVQSDNSTVQPRARTTHATWPPPTRARGPRPLQHKNTLHKLLPARRPYTHTRTLAIGMF